MLLIVSTLSLDVPGSDSFLMACSIVGGLGLPWAAAWRDVRSNRDRTLWWGILQSLVGTILGATVAHFLLGYGMAMAVSGGLGFGAALSLVTVPTASLLLFSVVGVRTISPSDDEDGEAFWVFAYGSLMLSGWEREFRGAQRGLAVLRGYRRAFNKSSIRNWGNTANPCPTLGLEEDATARCQGIVFRFGAMSRDEVVEYLSQREGSSFDLTERPVTLHDGTEVAAVVALNRVDASTYIGDMSIDKRASMIRGAAGTDGTCEKYLEQVHDTLRQLDVADEEVEGLVASVRRDRLPET